MTRYTTFEIKHSLEKEDIFILRLSDIMYRQGNVSTRIIPSTQRTKINAQNVKE